MKNFGIARLVVVSESEFDLDVARRLAVGAGDVLAGAKQAAHLGEAVAHSALVVGVTRRTGQKRTQDPFAPWQLVPL